MGCQSSKTSVREPTASCSAQTSVFSAQACPSNQVTLGKYLAESEMSPQAKGIVEIFNSDDSSSSGMYDLEAWYRDQRPCSGLQDASGKSDNEFVRQAVGCVLLSIVERVSCVIQADRNFEVVKAGK